MDAGSDARASGARRCGAGLTLTAILALATALRLPTLDSAMAPDEAAALVQFARHGITSSFLEPYWSGNHPLNSLVGWIAITLFGESNWAVHLPSLIAGLATVVLTFSFTRRVLDDTRAALSAALFLAVSPYPIAYSTNFRGYALVMFFGLASAFYLFENLQRPSLVKTFGLIVTLFLMGVSQLASLVLLPVWGAVLAVFALATLARHRGRSGRLTLGWLSSALGLGVAFALICVAYSPAFRLDEAIIARLTTGQWTDGANGFLCGAEQTEWHPFYRYTETITGYRSIPFVAAVAVALLGILAGLTGRRYGMGIVVAALVIPTAGTMPIHLRLEPRYLVMLAPFFLMALGAGTIHLARWLGKRAANPQTRTATAYVVLAVVLCGIPLAPLAKHYKRGIEELGCVGWDTDAATRYLADKIGEDDVVAYPQWGSWPTCVYLDWYVNSKLGATEEPASTCRWWYISSGMDEAQALACSPTGSMPSVINQFANCYVCCEWLISENWQRMHLGNWGEIPGNLWDPELLPWNDAFYTGTHGIAGGRDVDSGRPFVQITDYYGRRPEDLFSHAWAIEPLKRVLFRGYIDEIPYRNHGEIGIRFLDGDERVLAEWFAAAPRAQTPRPASQNDPEQSRYRFVQVAACAPPETTSFRVGIRVSPTRRAGTTVRFQDLELWADAPLANAAKVVPEETSP